MAIDQIHAQGLWKTNELKQKCVRLHKQYRLDTTTLAERFGWAPAEVTRILREAGCSSTYRPITERDLAKMIELHEQGLTPQQISKIVDRTRETVRRALKERGVEPNKAKRGRRTGIELPGSRYTEDEHV